jgi:7-cyano-7-deazaguanine reductase
MGIRLYYQGASGTSKKGFVREIKTMSERVEIELFDNPRPERDYCITIKCPEFTSLCPRTNQPDFGEIVIEYCPDKLCIELKSLKFYLHSYRNKGIFYEALTNDILDDLKGVCKPRWMKITSRFTPRGGITTEVVACTCGYLATGGAGTGAEYKAEK